MRNVCHRVCQQRQVCANDRRLANRRMRGERADVHMAIMHHDAGVIVQAADVDQ